MQGECFTLLRGLSTLSYYAIFDTGIFAVDVVHLLLLLSKTELLKVLHTYQESNFSKSVRTQ